MPTFTLRPYQQECLDVIARQAPGAYLCRLATGLGKTVIFTHLPRQGRMLILSHREELVHQPLKYFTCKTGAEQGAEHAPQDAEVVSASVQSSNIGWTVTPRMLLTPLWWMKPTTPQPKATASCWTTLPPGCCWALPPRQTGQTVPA